MHLSARASLFGRGTCIAFIQVAVRARRLLATAREFRPHDQGFCLASAGLGY